MHKAFTQLHNVDRLFSLFFGLGSFVLLVVPMIWPYPYQLSLIGKIVLLSQGICGVVGPILVMLGKRTGLLFEACLWAILAGASLATLGGASIYLGPENQSAHFLHIIIGVGFCLQNISQFRRFRP